MAGKDKEILIGTSALAYYLKRITAFLEGDKKTLSFPNISLELKDVLVKITTESMDFLNSDEYNNNVREESVKLASTIKAHYNAKLTHEFSDGKLGSNVLMYKKTEANTFKVPEPLRKPNVATSPSPLNPPSDGGVTQIFKTRCLNTTTQFVKSDSQLVMRYPEMVAVQAEFLMNMVLPGIQGINKGSEVGFGFRSMYAPLWEAMRVFGLKYDYKIGYDTKPVSKEGLKRVVFEKIPKRPMNSEINKIIKATEVIDLDRADSPEVIIELGDDDDLDSYSSSSSSLCCNDIKTTKRKTPRKKKPKCNKRLEKYFRKLRLQIEKGLLSKEFLHENLQRMALFLMDDQQDSIVMEKVPIIEELFLNKLTKISTNTAMYMLFSSQCQKFLDDIKYCINVKNVKYEMSHAKGSISTTSGNYNYRNLKFQKVSSLKVSDTTDGTTTEDGSGFYSSYSSKSTTSINTNSSGTQRMSREAEKENKLKKQNQKLVDKLIMKQRKGLINEEFIETTLKKICNFLFLQEQASIVFQPKTHHHLRFIQQVSIFARHVETYDKFTNKSQQLLANINAAFKKNMLYNVRLVKGQKDVFLEKMATFDFSNDKSQNVTERLVTNASDIIDVEMYEKSTPSPIMPSTVKTNKTTPNQFQQSNGKMDEHLQLVLMQIHDKIHTGGITFQFMENVLRGICKFLNDDNMQSLSFSKMSRNQLRFVEYADKIARDVSCHAGFNTHVQNFLFTLNDCLKNNTYIFKRIAGTKDAILEKVNHVSPKKPSKVIENNENVSNNIQNTSYKISPLTQSEQDQLIRLKAIKDAVTWNSGDQTILYYLRDISNFLTLSNTDRSITFEDVTENESQFLKNVHVMSKIEGGYSMFTNECQRLLRNIRFNAESYRLTLKMSVDPENGDLRTVTIGKQSFPADGQKTKEQKDRSRSLSGGRRTQQKPNSRTDTRPRDTSTQRLTVKEKLKAALAQPVHSDIALRMMESMGWKGGALGIRGEGITEPIGLPLDLQKRAGLGHVAKRPEPKPRKTKPESKPKEPPKTKPEPVVAKPKPAEKPKAADKQKTVEKSVKVPYSFLPLDSIPSDLVPPGILTADASKSKTIYLNSDYRTIILNSILEMITTDIDFMHFMCTQNPIKQINFIKHAVTVFKSRSRFDLTSKAELVNKISEIMDRNRDITLNFKATDKTDLYPYQIAMVRKRIVKSTNTNKLDAFLSLVDIEETMENQKPIENHETTEIDTQKTNEKHKTTDNQKTIENHKATDVQKTTENQITATVDLTTDADSYKPIWYETEPNITIGGSWYPPLKSKCTQTNKTRKTTDKTQETTKYLIPGLKTLALSAVCLQRQIDVEVKTQNITNATDVTEKTTTNQAPTTTNQAVTTTHQASTTTKSKMVLKIPNMTRKQMALSNKQTIERTTYKLEVEKRRIDKVYHIDVKVTKNPVENPRESKQKKRNETKSIENEKSPGELLLEKLSVKDDTSEIKSKKGKKKPKSVAVRLENAVANSEVTKREIINNAKQTLSNVVSTTTLNNVVTSNNLNNKSVVPIINSVAPRIDNFNTDVVAKGIGNINISEDMNKTNNKKDENQNDTNSVNHIMLLNTQIIAENLQRHDNTDSVQNDNVIVKNNTNIESNEHTENNIKSMSDDDDCQIVFDGRPINNMSEIIVLDSDDEIVPPIDNFTKDNEVINIENAISDDNSENIQENDLIVTENESDKFYDSIDTGLDTDTSRRTLDRKRHSIDYPNSEPKKCKLLTDYKKLYILPKDYPKTKIDSEIACQIQGAILKCIDYTRETLPYLKCQGIQNGGLIYCCQDEKSVFFLENLVNFIDDLKIVYEFDVEENLTYKMAFKINSYVDEPVYNVLNRLELYNLGLNATKWSFIKKEQHGDFIVIYVQIDDLSFNYVCEYNFVLYAGNDCARFSIVWE